MRGTPGMIRVYGIQDEDTYERTQAQQVWKRSASGDGRADYLGVWLRGEMEARIGKAPEANLEPILMYYQWENARRNKPGMRWRFGEKGDVIYRLTFEVERDRVLMCDRAMYERAQRGYAGDEVAERMLKAKIGQSDIAVGEGAGAEVRAIHAMMRQTYDEMLIDERTPDFEERAVLAFAWMMSWECVRRVERFVMR